MKNIISGLALIITLISFLGCDRGNKKFETVKFDSAFQNLNDRTLKYIIARNPSKHYLSPEVFSKFWQADTATISFRSETLEFDTSNYWRVSVNGMNLMNTSISNINYLFGKPDSLSSRADSLTLDYFLAPGCGFSEEGCYRWVLEIIIKQGIVTNFYQSFIRVEKL